MIGPAHSMCRSASGAAVVALTTALLLSAIPCVGQGYLVRPMRIEVRLNPRQTHTQAVHLVNTTNTAPMTIRLERYLLGQDRGGSWRALDPLVPVADTTVLPSCLPWMAVTPDTITVPPATSRQVEVRLTPPADADGIYGAMLAAVVVPPEREPRPNEAIISVQVRFLIPVIVRAFRRPPLEKATVSSVGLRSVAATGPGPDRTEAVLEVASQGTDLVEVEATANLYRMVGERPRRISEISFSRTRLFPGGRLELASNVGQALPAGQYRLAARTTVNGRSMGQIESTVDFEGTAGAGDVRGETELTVWPSSVEAALPPGGVRTVAVRVGNPGAEPLSLTAAFAVPRTLAGRCIGELKGEELSCAQSSSVSPPQVTIAPGRESSLRLTIGVPGDSTHANMYADLLLAARYSDGSPAGEARVPIAVSNPRVKDAPLAVCVGTGLAQTEPGKYSLRADFANVGNVHFRAWARASVRTFAGNLVLGAELEGPQEVLLPMATPTYSGVLDFRGVPAGVYRLAVQYVYGEVSAVQPVTTEMPIEVTVADGERVVTVIERETDEAEAEGGDAS